MTRIYWFIVASAIGYIHGIDHRCGFPPLSRHKHSHRSRKKEKTQSSFKRRHLFLVAGEGILDGLGGVANGILSRGKDALALVGGVVRAATGGITELLGGGLVALWMMQSAQVQWKGSLGGNIPGWTALAARS